MASLLDRLAAAFPEAEIGLSADAHPFVRVPAEGVAESLRRLRDELGCDRFVDLTATDDPAREDRFELHYLVYAMAERAWVRLKARTAGSAPSAVEVFPGANWCERELFDLFGVRFAGHPELTRMLMPDDWQGHPLRRDVPLGREPVDFTVTRDVYGT